MEEEKAVAMTDTVPKTFWHGVQTRGAKPFCRQKEPQRSPVNPPQLRIAAHRARGKARAG